MKTFISTLLLLIATTHCHSQSATFLKYNTDTNHLKIINKPILHEILQKSTAKLNWLIMYTNYCGGTKYILNEVNEVQAKYGDKVNIILCSSAPYAEIGQMLQVLAKANVKLNAIYIIDGEIYKDKKSDDRKKAFAFRKDICEECRKDIIGVPYSIMYNNKGEITQYGYFHQISRLEYIDNYIVNN